MANANISQVVLANSFNEWRIVTNNGSNSINELRNGNYYKDGGDLRVANGTIYLLKTSGTVLSVGADATVTGLLTTNTIINTSDVSILANLMLSSAASYAQFANNLTGKYLVSNNQITAQNVNVQGYLLVTGANLTQAPFQAGISGNAVINVANGIFASNTGNVEIKGRLNLSSNTSSLNVAGTLNANNFVANTATILNDLTVLGNTISTGTSVLSTNRFILSNGAAVPADAYIQVYRGAGANQASLRWTEANNAWEVLNTASNLYSTILTSTTGFSLNTPTLAGYREATTTANVTTTYSANLANTNGFDLTLGSSALTLTLINAAASGNTHPVTIMFRQGVPGGNTVTFANTILWSNGEVPVLATGNSKVDVITLFTVNGGTTYFGAHALANC